MEELVFLCPNSGRRHLLQETPYQKQIGASHGWQSAVSGILVKAIKSELARPLG